MNWYEIELKPRDVLFFRDARPMDGSHIGKGASWPLPSVWHQALLTAFHQRWPQPQSWERVEKHDRHPEAGSGRFGSLATCGLFPRKNGELLVPAPADLAPDGKSVAQLIENTHSSNLPPPLKYLVANFATPSKEKIGEWMYARDLETYLRKSKVDAGVASSDLFDIELRPGIQIDADTHATVTGQFYMGEYMRLREEVVLTGFARCMNGTTNIMDKWLENRKGRIVLGGQAGMAYLNGRRDKLPAPALPWREIGRGERIKWLLLTPARFNGGWLPAWVDANGKVRLKSGNTARRDGEDRKSWRQRVRALPEINAHLVAAWINKPLYVSGWNLVDDRPEDQRDDKDGRGPKATVALVPPGSIFYFEAADEQEAHVLRKALAGMPRSDAWGERGFGVGVCGTWKPGGMP